MIFRRFLLLAVFAAMSAAGQGSIFAQTGASLEAEIQNMERAVTRQGLSPSERHEALSRLARLRQLSGDIEGAARNWLETASAIPGRVDDEALLNCAFCLAAMGEWDRAATALEPLVSKMPRARFLDLSIRAIRTGDTTHLAAILEHPNYFDMKPEILFVLWKVSRSGTGERWRQRLAAEFAQTPEGRLASGQSSSSFSIRPSPFWLFASGLDSLPLIAGSTGQPSSSQTTTVQTSTTPAPPASAQTPRPAAQTSVNTAQATPVTQTQQTSQSSQTVRQPQTAAQPQTVTQPQSAAPQTSSASSPRLQTGAFAREANAQAMINNLRNAGFTPSVERRTINNTEVWAVTVPAGADQARTMNSLRAAGFDSFLVR